MASPWCHHVSGSHTGTAVYSVWTWPHTSTPWTGLRRAAKQRYARSLTSGERVVLFLMVSSLYGISSFIHHGRYSSKYKSNSQPVTIVSVSLHNLFTHRRLWYRLAFLYCSILIVQRTFNASSPLPQGTWPCLSSWRTLSSCVLPEELLHLVTMLIFFLCCWEHSFCLRHFILP